MTKMKVIVTISDPMFGNAICNDMELFVNQLEMFGGFLSEVFHHGKCIVEIRQDDTTFHYREYFLFNHELLPKMWRSLRSCLLSAMVNNLSQFNKIPSIRQNILLFARRLGCYKENT